MRTLLTVLAVSAAAVAACSSSEQAGSSVETSSSPALPPVEATANRPSAPAPSEDDAQTGHGGASLTSPLVFVGRFDTSDPIGPKAAWPGTRILARFDATAVSVRLSEHAEASMDGAPSYWEVSIDGGPWAAFAMKADDRPRVFDLVSHLPSGPHQLELYKRSETQTGVTQFLGVNLHGGHFLPPPLRQTRHIEVIGGSEATGLGVERLGAPGEECAGPDHAGVHESFRKAWGGRLGVTFDAEVHGIVYSGKGLVRNVGPTDDDPLAAYYPRANPDPALATTRPPMFDLASWLPDVIVLTQGSVDLSAGVPREDFAAAYHDFVVKTLRGRAPNAHIVMGVLDGIGRDVIPGVARDIIAERAASGDHALSVFEAGPATAEERAACNGHGTPSWHQRVADELAAQLRAELGWK